MMEKQARAVVEERDYAVAARVRETDESGEEIAKSDRFLIALDIQRAARESGHPVELVEEDGQYSLVAELGDASDADFDEVAGALLEASS